MKIDEIFKTNAAYTSKDIARKQANMAKQLQIKWATDKQAFAQQNKPISVVDYINRVLPVVRQVNPTFGSNVGQNLSGRDENNLIAIALDTALKATNYWQRQIEKSAGMEPSGYNAPATQPSQAAPTARTSAPPVGQAPRNPPALPAAQTLTFNSPAGPVTFTFNGTQWLNPKGQPVKNPKTIAQLNTQLATQSGSNP